MAQRAAQGDCAVSRGRQLPGAACDECRRRKLQCDRQKPRCGVCQDSQTRCEVTQRSVRGPKRGHVRALKDRILHLETMLETRQEVQQHLNETPIYQAEMARSISDTEAANTAGGGGDHDDDTVSSSLSGGISSANVPSLFLAPHALTTSSLLQGEPMSPGICGLFSDHLRIPEVMRDELYVNHEIANLVHRMLFTC